MFILLFNVNSNDLCHSHNRAQPEAEVIHHNSSKLSVFEKIELRVDTQTLLKIIFIYVLFVIFVFSAIDEKYSWLDLIFRYQITVEICLERFLVISPSHFK